MLQKIKNIYHFLVASAALIYYRFPAKELTVIGVTGTDGKTTTTSLIYHLLLAAGFKVAMINSVEVCFGPKKVPTGLHVTTPDPWPLQKIIRQLVDQGFTHLVLESTSHGLDQHRLLGSNFKIAVFTNVTHEHLDYHRTWENYLKVKAKLMLGAKLAILNRDDQSFKQLDKLAKKYQLRVISYGQQPGADFQPHKVKLKTDSSGFQLKGINFRLPLPGVYNLDNALAAISAVNALGVSFKAIQPVLNQFKGVKGRMEEVKNKFGFRVFVDFAHTPNALARVLTAMRLMTKKRLIAVYGSAGLRDQTKRSMMGEVGARLADVVILTAEDPRTEDVNQIISQMAQGCLKGRAKLIKQVDRQKAINLAVRLAKSGDVIGILGKGHEQSMCFNSIEMPWSDYRAVERALISR
ncbi:UDP-N-acetylmuramoyl-L-alanyl-D-glutamate--2,6-diaminopimelate ligase [Patescibacteria group bacterium]|nr:UDP-N-acetylmuramoyl-L-alanyl-D-glutamate--2,6-diaminopimelate ligase [Patescibacteria group bacterium]MBU1931664.1 UDP-N-acetylmuramoyl-L-alanyl-D-glutamate--2,6-diaminopimelate ligase [Patescibacteria group bacterium]